MSRIGKKPIELPRGVTVEQEEGRIVVSGPKGMLSAALHPAVTVSFRDNTIVVAPAVRGRQTPALWGLTRALIAGMVEGVSRGYEKKLEIEGVGYRANLDGTTLELALGFSHPVRVEAPAGVTFRVEKNAVVISGIDKALVGDVAARVRALRPPEPYKGKGIRYSGEIIRRKAGKKAATAGTGAAA